MAEKKYWFGRKRYGWGYSPVTWEGWASLVVLIAVVAIAGALLGKHPSAGATAAYVVFVVVAIGALIGLCLLKGPPMKWQWGGPRTPRDDEPPR